MAEGRSRATQRGVSLIEVLVAVVILSVAFLGVAALQAMALSSNNSAMARSMATVATYSIFDAMRADKDNAITNGAYNTATALKANACPNDTSTLAGVQLRQWCSQLGSSLGVAETTTGNIDCRAAGDCTVTITFMDVRAGADTTTRLQTVTTKAML